MGNEMTHCYGRRSEITKHYDTGKAGRLHFAVWVSKLLKVLQGHYYYS